MLPQRLVLVGLAVLTRPGLSSGLSTFAKLLALGAPGKSLQGFYSSTEATNKEVLEFEPNLSRATIKTA